MLTEFTLYYRGSLWANGKPKHKHELRKHFHKQIKELWNQPPLNEHRHLIDPTYEPTVPRGSMVVTAPVEKPSVVRTVGAFNFASIVSPKINLVADLSITLLRPGPPGEIVTQGGDLDNRIKTLLDALKIPERPSTLPDGASPEADEDPLFCLLDDDNLVISLTIKADRLLEPNAHRSLVVLLIHVRTKPTVGTHHNLGLL